MRRWAKELKSLNHGYKWKRVFEMFSSEVAEKQKGNVWKCSEHRGNKLFIIPQLSRACFMHKYGQKRFLKSCIVIGKDKEARRSVGRLPCSPEGKRSPGGLIVLGRGCSGEGMLPGGP